MEDELERNTILGARNRVKTTGADGPSKTFFYFFLFYFLLRLSIFFFHFLPCISELLLHKCLE